MERKDVVMNRKVRMITQNAIELMRKEGVGI